MKKLLSFLLKNITGTDQFEIEETIDGDHETYDVKVDKEFVGMVIGKDGSVIRNIRKVMSVKAALENKLVSISISEK